MEPKPEKELPDPNTYPRPVLEDHRFRSWFPQDGVCLKAYAIYATVIAIVGISLTGCTQNIVKEQAKGQARKGEIRAVASWECPEPVTERCLSELEFYDSTDNSDTEAQLSMFGPNGEAEKVFDITRGEQKASPVVAAVESQSIATAQAAVQIAAIQGQAFAEVFRTLAAAGVQIANPAGGVFTNASEFQAWAEGQQHATASEPLPPAAPSPSE